MIERIEDTALAAKQPLVSVGILAYNHSEYLAECIESVLMQVCDFEVEIVIGDDGSTDSTVAICRDYQRRFSASIRLILFKQNQGVMKSYLRMYAEFRGEYFAQIAGDDYWTDPYKLQKQVDFFRKNPNCGLCYTDFGFYWPHDNSRKQYVFASKEIVRSETFEDYLVNRRFLAPLTWMIKKAYNPNNFNYDGKNYVDESFVFLLDLFHMTDIGFIPDSTAVKRVIKGSVSIPYKKEEEYTYLKGLFSIQKEYISKYNVSEDIRTSVYSDSYFQLALSAATFNDQSFLAEAKSFFAEQNIKSVHYFDNIDRLIDFNTRYAHLQCFTPKYWIKKIIKNMQSLQR